MDLSLWPSILLGGWGHGTWTCAQAEAWQAGPPPDDPCLLPAHCLPPSWWAAMDGLPSAGLFAHCAGEGKWAPGSCRPAMDVLAAGDRTVAAVSWLPLPGPAGACFAVEKQLGAAWHPASRLPPPPLLWQSVYPAVSLGTGNSEGMCTELGARWLSELGPRCGVPCADTWQRGGLWSVRPGTVVGPPACPQHGSQPPGPVGCPDHSVAQDTCPGATAGASPQPLPVLSPGPRPVALSG